MKYLAGLTVLAVLFLGLSGCEAEQADKGRAESATYRGWVIMYRGLEPHQRMPGYFDNQALDDDSLWVWVGDLRWSSDGTRVPVIVDGVDTGYEVELDEVTYTAGKVDIPVMKLAVYHKDVERALAYTWAASGSSRIGINLRWMQAGLTRL